MNKRSRIQSLFEYIVDLVMLFIANSFAYIICEYINKLPAVTTNELIEYALIILFSYMLIFFGFTASIDLSRQNRYFEMISVCRNCILTYMTIAVMLVLTKNDIIQSRHLYVISLFLFIILSSIGRYALKRILIYNFSKTKMASLVGVVTTSDRAENFIKNLSNDWSKKVKGIILIDAVEDNGNYKCHRPIKELHEDGSVTTVISKDLEYVDEICGYEVVANKDNFIDWVRAESVDEIFINIPYTSNEFDTASFIEELESMGIIVHTNLPNLEKIIDASEFNNFTCEVYAKYPFATLSAVSHNATLLCIKRIVDVIGALVGIIISTPIILVTAIPLLIESPGPLIFKQQRVGKNGRLFNIYKLRSMYVDAEERKKELMKNNKMDGLMFKMDDDPRITKVGKFIRKTSIDELPQFWNVLKGDMSLIGTRPPTIDEFEQYESHHKRRLSMRPGITGMWQVSGRSDITDFEEVVRLDCQYIDNWTAWLDIKILFKTIKVVLTHRGAE